MAIKTISIPYYGISRNIYAIFGWKYVKTIDEYPGRVSRPLYLLQRDTEMENIDKILPLERKFFTLQNNRKIYDAIEWDDLALLFTMFIIPGIIYLLYKKHKKNKIDEENLFIDNEQARIIESVKTIRNLSL